MDLNLSNAEILRMISARAKTMPAHMDLVARRWPKAGGAGERILERLCDRNRRVVVTSSDGGGWSRPLPPVIKKWHSQRFQPGEPQKNRMVALISTSNG